MNYAGQITADLPLSLFYVGVSALDRYFELESQEKLYLTTDATLIDLARTFSDVSYPGVEYADVEVRYEGLRLLIRSVDSLQQPPRHVFAPMDVLYDPAGPRFIDRFGVYPLLREGKRYERAHPTARRAESVETEPDIQRDAVRGGWDGVREAAVLAARYPFVPMDDRLLGMPRNRPDEPEQQREVLEDVLTSREPWLGLRLLERHGYVQEHWPELEQMRKVGHSKEHHPEGDVWEHTLETFRYRKVPDLALSLALLFHDSGKPVAEPKEGRRFDRHAEIGTRIAQSFLRRLGFAPEVLDEVSFLVRHHMMPAALRALPIYRTERLMASESFPKLLELYRCDLSSTFRRPEGYHEACRVYRSFLKHTRNPFRSPDGKKLVRMYVE